MTIKKSRILTTTAIFLSCMSLYSHAITYRLPTPTNSYIEPAGTTGGAYAYFVSMAAITVHDDTISETDTVADVLERHGLDASTAGWNLFQEWTGSTVKRAGRIVIRTAAYANMPWKEFTEKLITEATSGPLNLNVPNLRPDAACIGGAFYPTRWVGDALTAAQWAATAWSGNAGQPTSCMYTPPLNEWCALNTPVLTLSHGEVNLANGTNVSVSNFVSVECTNDLTYSLKLATDKNSIDLNNGMVATLTMDDKPLGTALGGKAEVGNTVKIASYLAGTPNRTGPFEGSGILLLYYP